MPDDLGDALAALRPLLLDEKALVRAVAAGRRRTARPQWERVELRPVDLKAGRRLQIVTSGVGAPVTRNEVYGPAAEQTVDDLLADAFGNWHVQTTTETVQLRVTKKGKAQLHRAPNIDSQHTGHDREKPHLIDPGDPLFTVLGAGASKRRQVDAFLHVLAGAVDDADLPTDRPLRVVDLGCGNAYLTFAAYRYLSERGEVDLVGIDLREEARARNTAIAADLGWSDHVHFEAAAIGTTSEPPYVRDEPRRYPHGSSDTTEREGVVDVVLALHACDTATDDALAQAVRWEAPLVLAAPCCHHDLQRQLKGAATPEPYGLLTRHPILRERFGDALTDAFRASLLRRVGYRADVIQFVDAEYTPRNTMIRAVRRAASPDSDAREEYDELVRAWGVTPYLQTLLVDADR
ncbi:MAG: SAM-dependent methyltransferase [Sporichthyaceae bacterium]